MTTYGLQQQTVLYLHTIPVTIRANLMTYLCVFVDMPYIVVHVSVMSYLFCV